MQNESLMLRISKVHYIFQAITFICHLMRKEDLKVRVVNAKV